MASPRCNSALRGCLAAAALLAAAAPVNAAGFAAVYDAYWAGLPAATISLAERDDGNAYHDAIRIRTHGLPALVTRFHGAAAADGALDAGQVPHPAQFDASYDLRKRRDRRLVMNFVARNGTVVAERGPADTSRKPPLAERFRRNVIDPMSAVTAIRAALRAGRRGSFVLPLYDGARRFDVAVRVLPKERNASGTLRVDLVLKPIAGFKGESSDDGDPDTAPRTVALTLSDDAQLLPLSLRVPIYYLPLVVKLARRCARDTPCGG